MRIEAANNEDGYVPIYEPGDKIRVTRSNTWNVKPGDVGKITKGPFRQNFITCYEIILDNFASGWGYMDIPEGYLEPYGITRAKLPELVREWKKDLARKLIGAE